MTPTHETHTSAEVLARAEQIEKIAGWADSHWHVGAQISRNEIALMRADATMLRAYAELLEELKRVNEELDEIHVAHDRAEFSLAKERWKVRELRAYHEQASTMGDNGPYWFGVRDGHTAALAKMDSLALPASPETPRETYRDTLESVCPETPKENT